MAVSPESMPEKPISFSAPPPSPIASGRRSSCVNDDVLSEFLEHSLRVPDLILPDKVFPRQKFIEKPPKIDFQLLGSDSVPKILDAISTIGCFQLVNYGIAGDSLRSALAVAAGIFRLPPEKRTAVTRSSEKLYGFEEIHSHGEEEEDGGVSEEFVWCKGESLKLEMEKIWPMGYSNFSEKMDTLLSNIEKVAEKILFVIKENCPDFKTDEMKMMQGQNGINSACYLYKHRQNEEWSNSLRYDVIRMLIRGIDYSHALCLHLYECDGSSEFHVYSKKGWLSFCPDKDALLITIGDQTQALSGGQFKHVIGRPIYKGEREDYISMAFLYSPTATPSKNIEAEKGKTISLTQQAIAAILLTLAYHILVYVCHKF